MHIFANAGTVDAELSAGSHDIVDRIADITVQDKKHRNYFSFASKYCSWHRPELYPIYDNRVLSYLCSLQKQDQQDPFTADFKLNKSVWVYADFVKVIEDFKKRYALERFSYKQIDQFLWLYSEAQMPPEVTPVGSQ